MSLSARRAWIEIPFKQIISNWQTVALRKESVDRNLKVCQMKLKGLLSLSARRAWIEITAHRYLHPYFRRRSPQGERG